MSFKELTVPVMLLAVLASLLIPLPAPVIDVMLVANIVLALVLLASTLYLTNPLKISSLPSIMLLTTLYRLALNVSTTRAILSTGEAGTMIEAFGSVVIGDNLVVGAVVFLIITLIQFIVIAKGSERVAEVSARFTLDALPGKQMSIDADVRAGLISFAEARGKRQELQIESRFYGALDGAMKFIKGDAIAGLAITAVNVAGGLVLGIMVQHLEPAAAVSKYTLLTVGDGLLSQIPALLNSLAAGMVVTRVERGDGSSLATEVLSQIGQVRKVQVLIGIVCLCLAASPGMPVWPFLMLGAFLFAAAILFSPSEDKTEQAPQNKVFDPRTPPPLEVELAPDLTRLLLGEGNLSEALDAFRQKAYERHGLILLPPEVNVNKDLRGAYQVLMRGIPAAGESPPAEAKAITLSIIECLCNLVDTRAPEFVDDILTRRVLDHFETGAPELIQTLVPDVISVTQLSEVLKALAEEQLSIRNFDLILQAVAEHRPKTDNIRRLLEEVRVNLRRLICARYAPGGVLKAVTISPITDLMFLEAEREGKRLDYQCVSGLVEACRQWADADECVLLVTRGARRLVRDCLTMHEVRMPVLAHEEIVSEVKIKVLDQIEVDAGFHEGMEPEPQGSCVVSLGT
jgi:flagellar biosynthesis component FlhA